MSKAVAPGPRSDQATLGLWLTARGAFLFLASYFLLQALLRVFVSDSAELDESEQLLWTQAWRWGYRSEPPLYTWLQILIFQILGTNVLGLALLKNLLLISGFAFTYLAAREITPDEQTSSLAMLSLLLFPQIMWESQRDLTHSVLATSVAAATFFVAIRVWKSGKAIEYLLLGVVTGLGTLSKYSFTLFALALVLGALTIPELRRRLTNKWLSLMFLGFFAVTALHFRWALLHPELVLSRAEEVVREVKPGFIVTRLNGLLSVGKCCLTLSGALVVVYWITFGRGGRFPAPPDVHQMQRWIGRTLLILLTVSLMVVLALGLELRDRWFQPIVFLGAISAAWHFRDKLTISTEKRFARVVGGLALVVLLVLPGIPLAASITRRPTRLNAPYSSLNAQLKAVISAPGVIVAGTRLVGGNLRLSFKESTVIVPEFTAMPLFSHAPWLVVWDATKSDSPSPSLVGLVSQLRGINLAAISASYVEAPLRNIKTKTMKLGYVRLPGLN